MARPVGARSEITGLVYILALLMLMQQHCRVSLVEGVGLVSVSTAVVEQQDVTLHCGDKNGYAEACVQNTKPGDNLNLTNGIRMLIYLM